MNIELGFIIKKMISILLMPLSIGIVVALIALLLFKLKKEHKAKKYLWFSIAWILLITWAPFGSLMLKPLESQYPKLHTIPQNIEYILLLGGDRERRAWEALRLYQKIPNVKIITSGYSLHDQVSDAKKTATLLIESGIKKEDIYLQELAKTTYEETIWMKKRVGEKPFILVTAAYHMPRAMKLFQEAGLNPIPAPADFNHPQEDSLLTVLQSKQLEKTEHAWHEYLGLLWMQLRTFTASLK